MANADNFDTGCRFRGKSSARVSAVLRKFENIVAPESYETGATVISLYSFTSTDCAASVAAVSF